MYVCMFVCMYVYKFNKLYLPRNLKYYIEFNKLSTFKRFDFHLLQ